MGMFKPPKDNSLPILSDNSVKLLDNCFALFVCMHIAIKMLLVENVTEVWNQDSLSARTLVFHCLSLKKKTHSECRDTASTALAGKTIYTCEEIFFYILYTTK